MLIIKTHKSTIQRLKIHYFFYFNKQFIAFSKFISIFAAKSNVRFGLPKQTTVTGNRVAYPGAPLPLSQTILPNRHEILACRLRPSLSREENP